MNEKDRLEDLLNYKILDTAPEKDLDDLIEIASALCGTPIALITLIDDKRQWFKSSKGLAVKETLREDSFCQHALNTPNEVLVVEDSYNDERFRNNVLVTGKPNIRFYAGAPLETPKGNVLGTLCIIDSKPREISEAQKRALQLLAKKAMDFLNARKIILDQGNQIESNAIHLKKLTDQVPGCIYQFERTAQGETLFHFISNGITDIYPLLTPDAIRNKRISLTDLMLPEDKDMVLQALNDAYHTASDLNFEFRIPGADDENPFWYWARAKAEKKENGNVIWYGVFQDITIRKSYEQALEQISFDISHVLRRPVTTMLGLTAAIQREEVDAKTMKEYIEYIKIVSQEMDSFTQRLDKVYSEKKDRIGH